MGAASSAPVPSLAAAKDRVGRRKPEEEEWGCTNPIKFSTLWMLATLQWVVLDIYFLYAYGDVQYAIDLSATAIFLLGSVVLVFACLPSYQRALEARLDAPPPPSPGWLHTYVLHNRTLLATQLFNAGMPVLVAEAVVWMVEEPDNWYGYLLFAGVLLIWPHLMMWSMLSTDASLRNNRGDGTTVLWDEYLADWLAPASFLGRGGCCGWRPDVAFWKRHFGTDKLIFSFVTLAGMLVSFGLGLLGVIAWEVLLLAGVLDEHIAWYVWYSIGAVGIFAASAYYLHIESYPKAGESE